MKRDAEPATSPLTRDVIRTRLLAANEACGEVWSEDRVERAVEAAWRGCMTNLKTDGRG